jgi:DNA-directed RNA polymerase subunit beta'
MTDTILVGGEAFKAMLSEVSPDKKIPELLELIKTTKSVSKRDSIIKQLKYLSGLKASGLKGQEAYILHNVPVIPPRMRPASVVGSNKLEFADVNNLYKDHMLINNSLNNLKDLLPPEELIKEREDAYNGVKAIVGLGEAISPNSRGRGVTGLLKQVAGTGGPKTGLFHNKVLSKKQDFSGRATIYAEPNLGFNEAAVPKDMLWTMYKFHILRDLSKKGYDYVNAEKAWSDRSPAAVASFTKMTKSVPIIINRAPTLMKSNITAVYPVPIEGNTMGISPLHLPMFAADFDGDSFSLFLPQSSDAVNEAKEKLLPQVQIHDYRKGLNQSIISPGHEAILGSIHMTEPDMTQQVVKFKTEEDCLKALKAGQIKENTPVEIG